MATKKMYNVFANTHGVRSWCENVLEEHFREGCEIIETPTCFLRIHKRDLSSKEYIKHIKSYFARYRVNPSYPCTVQWTTGGGRWVNGPTFSTNEEAQAFVTAKNELLEPFADSPYFVKED